MFKTKEILAMNRWIKNQEIVEKNLEKPLSSIPDPFEKFDSFSQHNNEKLKELMQLVRGQKGYL